ncbi:MAG: hypothetical protein AAF478_11225 [Pseudomonadota bacterium]
MGVFNRNSRIENAPVCNSGRSDGTTLQPPFDEAGVVLGVNGKLLQGFLAGGIAWWCWPSDPYWWGFYIYSVILWAASVCFVAEGLRSYFKLRAAKRRWRAIEKMGNRPKNARLVGKSGLQQKGMN